MSEHRQLMNLRCLLRHEWSLKMLVEVVHTWERSWHRAFWECARCGKRKVTHPEIAREILAWLHRVDQ